MVFILIIFFPQTKESINSRTEVGTYKAKALNDSDFGAGTEELVIKNDQAFKSGVYEYKSFLLESGNLTINNQGPAKLVIKARDKITIKNEAKIDLSGRGHGNDGEANEIKRIDSKYAGGGGSHGGAGGTGDCLNNNKAQNSELLPDSESYGGSGGVGDKDRNGVQGSGGGFIELIAPEVVIDGEIVANGEDGTESGGGGAGGKIVILSNKILLSGKLSATGGSGGSSQIQGGGGGGGGIVTLNKNYHGKGTLEVAGGRGGQALDIYTGCNGGNGDLGKIFIGS